MTEYVTDVCKECGNLRSVCSDPERTWYPQRSVCYSKAVTELTWRRVTDKYGHASKDDGLHFTDGLGLWASEHDLSPEDDFV